MNMRQGRTHKTFLPCKGVFVMPLPEWDGGGGPQKPSKTTYTGVRPIDDKGVKVLIASDDPFVTDFLRGLVAIHGYETEVVLDFHQAYVRVRRGFAHVVLIDDACFGIGNFKKFLQRMQKLIQAGVPVILLTDEHTRQYLQRHSTIKFFGIMRKPVGYRQIGQVLADLVPG